MIAGDHLHADTGRAAFLDRRENFLAGWIEKAHQADESRAARDIRDAQILLSLGEALHSESQHALAVPGDGLGFLAPGLDVQWRTLVRAKLPVAHVQDLLRRAFDEGEAGPVFVAMMQRRHEAMLGIEGNLIGSWRLLAQERRVETGLHAETDQRALHGIAVDRPVAICFAQFSIVTQDGRARGLRQRVTAAGIDGCAIRSESALRSVAHAGHIEQAAGGQHAPYRHLVAGERARLVRADHRDRPKRLHRRQPADDGVPGGHALDADGKRDSHHRGQAFGDRGDGEADHDHERVRPGVVAHINRERKDGRTDSQDQHGEQSREAVHLPYERRGKLFDRAHEGADAAELAVRSRGDGDARCRSVGDERSGEGHGGPVRERGIRWDRVDALIDGERLASQCGLIDAEVACAYQTQIRRNPCAGLQQDEIARYDIFGGDVQTLAIAYDRRMRVDHPANGFERALRPPFLDETDNRVENDHRDDDRRIHQIADRRGQYGGGNKHVDQKIVELQQEAHEGAPLLHLGEAVRAVMLPARYGFACAQTVLKIDTLRGHNIGSGLREWQRRIGRHRIIAFCQRSYQ